MYEVAYTWRMYVTAYVTEIGRQLTVIEECTNIFTKIIHRTSPAAISYKRVRRTVSVVMSHGINTGGNCIVQRSATLKNEYRDVLTFLNLLAIYTVYF